MNFRTAISALIFSAAAAVGSAQVIAFPDFSTTTGLTLNAADLANNHILLAANQQNRSGSIFTSTQLDVSGFSAVFEFRISSPGGTSDGISAGADGIAFVLQRSGATALGGNGEALGYGQRGGTPAISPSVAVEFDTFKNTWDPSTNHLGINTGGNLTSVASVHVPDAFDNGTTWTAWVDYNGSVLEVRLSQNGVRPETATLAHTLDIVATLGGASAFIGFTGATGSAFGTHEILNFAYADSYLSGGLAAVPEPSTYALMALGLGLVGLTMRRRRTRG